MKRKAGLAIIETAAFVTKVQTSGLKVRDVETVILWVPSLCTLMCAACMERKSTANSCDQVSKDIVYGLRFYLSWLSRWWFQYGLFSPLPGEMIQVDEYFSNGLKPPASYTLE